MKDSTNKLCSIIIPHHNRHDHLNKLLDCLDNRIFEIIMVSGGSFAENCNKGAKIAETDKLFFVNDDTTPKVDDFIKMCDVLNYIDIVGSTQITKNKLKYYGIGIEYSPDGFEINNYKPTYYPMIETNKNKTLFPSGFLFGVDKNIWHQLNGFNTNFKTGYEDVDLGIRMLINKYTISILELDIYHHESESEDRFKYDKENSDLLYELYTQEKLKELYENTNYCI